jgi:predicted nucleic acid-binding protein
MNTKATKYCLDANVLIQAWQKYYNPKFCSGYWKVLTELGKQGKIFVPELVYEEIVRTEDDLSKWLKGSKIPINKITEAVTVCLQGIYSANPIHKNLVDNTKARSLADPWVIAHALHENAIVVTKEEKVTALNSNRIKIPNVCDNMGVKWINDFQLVSELGIKFQCTLTQ